MSGRRRLTRIIPLLLAAAVLLAAATALLLLPPTPGHAQSADATYISNIGKSASNYTSSLEVAQSFATGSQTGGYTVTHVDIGSDDPDGDAFSAAIYTTNASGHPVSEVAALTPPSSFAAGTLTFTAPANTTLEASTTYTVRIVNSSNNVTLDATTEDAEDPGGATGWSIGNDGYFLNASGTWVSINRAIRIAIRAEPKFVDFSDLQTGHTSPIGMWSPDGSTLWVGQWFSTQVYAYNLADETANYSENWTLHNPATVSDSNRKPTGIWSNGTNIYVTDPDHDRVFQYNAGDKSLTSTTYSLHADNGKRQGLWSDGTTAWVSDNDDDKLYAYQLSDFSRQSGKDIDLHSDNGEARGIWSDGTTIWVLDSSEEKIYAYTLSDGSRDSGLDIDLDGAGLNYNSIWSDGTTMYVVENTSGSATRAPQIHKLPLPAQTVVWNATLTSADNWALGSTYTYDGYGSSAFGSSIPTTQGSLSPDSFTVGTTTHTVQILGVREGTDNRLYLFTDTAVLKSDLAEYAMEFTVDGSTTTLKVKDATDQSNLGFYWAASLHSFGPDDWQAKTITVKLLLIVPGAPTALTVTEGHHAVKLDWTAPADDGGSAITGYEVTANGGTSSFQTGSTSESFTVAFQSDNNYPFQVRAVNANGEGPWSSAVTGTIGPATVTIAGDGGVNEGVNAEFILTASKPVLSSLKPLDVSVLVSESEDMVATAEEGTKTVSFAMGDTTATLSVPTVDDGVVESDSVVTAAIQTNTDYTVGTDGSGTVSVTDQGATVNSPATGAPTISGTAQVGQTLTAATSGIMDSNGLATPGYTYQWIRVDGGTDANISGATSSTYTLVAADLGKTIKVKVSFTDDDSNAETLTSAATAAVTAAATVPDAIADLLARPGNTQVTLSWTAFDDGGSTITKFEYRQKTSGSYGSWMDISNSPSTVSHTVTGLTTGTAYTFQVRAMNGVGNAGVSNEATATPGYAQSGADVSYVSNIGQGSDDDDSSSQVRAQTFTTGSRAGGYTVTSVDIGSDDAEGDSFTANLSITDPTSGNPVAKVATLTVPTSFTAGTLTFIAPPYTVLEPNTTYSVTITVDSNNVTLDTTLSNGEDSGRTSGWSIANTSHRVDGGDWAETTDGESIRIAINGPANPARGAPTITGTAQVGEALTAVTSGISDADGLTSPVYTYQWIRVDGGTDAHITGATSITYVPVAADTGKTIRVRVRFTDDLNYSEERTSAATAVVNAPATDEPTIIGITQVGETLTADPSLIMDANGLTSPGYTYQWIRVDGTDTDISGATSNTYTLVAADQGKTIKVRARFTDDDGYSEERTSAATAAVSPPPPAGLLVSITVDAGDEQITDGRPTPSSVPKAKFRVSIPAALTANLDVTINISEVSDTRTDLGNAQTANYVAAAGEGPKTVTIPAGDTSAVHQTPIETFSSNSRYEGDQVFEQDGDVVAEVAPGFGYRASASAPSASVRVLDVDQRFHIRALHSDGSPLTGGARLTHIRVDEGGGRVVVLYECVTLYDREPRSRISLKFSTTTQAADPISAEYRNRQDYRSFAEQVACREEGDPLLGWTSASGGDLGVPPSSTGFRRVQRDGGYIYQSVYTGVHHITDDQVYDPDEFFGVKLQRGPNLTNKVTLIGTATPGLTGSGFSHRVTILDDARPPANLEATVEGVVVGLTWDELPGDRAVQTYEVKVNDGPWRALDTGPRTHTWIGGLTPGVENTITVGARYWGPERPRFGRGDCDVFNCSVKVMGPMLDTAHADGPGAVTGLAVVSRMAVGEAKLSWTPPSDTGASGISGYQWRATGGSFDVEPEFLNQWHDIATSVIETDGNTTSAIINWLEGVDHTIYVRAWGGAVASVTLTGTGANQPTNLRATAVADTWVTLSWTAPSVRPETVDEYHVETRDPFTDNQWSYGGEGTGGNGTTYTVEGLEPGVKYIFRVRGASDILGLFTPSDYFARGTLRAGSPALALAHVVYPPGATSLFASANGGSRIDLGWITTNPASTSYDLEWSADGETGWQAVDPDDDGADTTYGHTGMTAGTTYYYRVRGVNGDGPGPWALAAATTTTLAPREAQAANTPATGAPSISGTAQVGETLTADTSDIADADGLAKAAFSYQWQAGGADISGATDSTYTLVDDDAGKAVSVAVSFTDDAGSAESVTSAATAAVEAPHAPQEAQGAAGGDAAEPTDRPHGLTAEASGGAVVLTWKAPEGYRSDYRILRNRPELGEAEPLVYVAYTDTTDVTYTDTDVEPGVLYVYSVTALDFLGDAGEASRPVEIRMQATSQQQTANSPATGAPAITGTAQVGETLTADTSGVADADGLTSAAFGYQWQAGGAGHIRGDRFHLHPG